MTQYTPLVAAIFAFLAIFLIALGFGQYMADRFGRETREKRRHLKMLEQVGRAGVAASTRRERTQLHGAVIRMFGDKGFFLSLEKLVERSSAQWDAVDMLLASPIAAGAGFLTSLLLFDGRVGISLVMGLIAGALPMVYLQYKANKRAEKFQAEFPDALDFLARALLAGHSLNLAITLAGDELPAPIGQEFRKVSEELAFGLPLTVALGNLVRRVDNPDVSFFVVALRIQHETGGNLARLFENLATTVRDRLKFTGRVRVLASEGRASGTFLAALPLLLGILQTALNPDYMDPLFSTSTGHLLMAVGTVMLGLGLYFARRVATIEV